MYRDMLVLVAARVPNYLYMVSVNITASLAHGAKEKFSIITTGILLPVATSSG